MRIDRHEVTVSLNKHNDQVVYLDIEEMDEEGTGWIVLAMSRAQAMDLGGLLVGMATAPIVTVSPEHTLKMVLPEHSADGVPLVEPLGAIEANDYQAYERGWAGDVPGLSWHNEFARCPSCQHATVGTSPPFGINHARDCDYYPNTTSHFFKRVENPESARYPGWRNDRDE